MGCLALVLSGFKDRSKFVYRLEDRSRSGRELIGVSYHCNHDRTQEEEGQ
jgi:hypothetical protein